MSSAGGRAGPYCVREQQLSLRAPVSSYQQLQPSFAARPKSGYASFPSSQPTVPPPYPKSVITFEFYDPPPHMAASVSDPSPHQLVSSPQRRPLQVMAPPSSSPKPAAHRQFGVKKLGSGGGKLGAQRTNSVSPTSLGHYQTNSGFFTITAYLPFDGGKRLKLQCTPGMTVQQVIETEIPDISRTGYQVYHFPSRALLNPEKDAGVLQDQEICIEPMRLHNQGEVNDKRLVIVQELLRTEDMYLESLRTIFDVYMEPLRKWSLPQAEMNIMFRSLSRLCDLLMNFFSELEIAVGMWDTRRTLIGGLFRQYPSFWDLYDEYGANYPKAIRLLKGKCQDDAFSRFLAMKRGAARHTLESLMLLPVQRIYEYHRLLVQLFTITSKDHLDYDDLRLTVARVQHMVQSREHQLTQSENVSKLDQVQARFPNDTLYLSETLEAMEALTRRSKTSSPAGGNRNQHKKSMNGLEDQNEMVDTGQKGSRSYIQEGPAKFLSGVQSQDRYLFLFDDILLVAKPAGRQRAQQRTFRLKHRVRLSDLWMLDKVEPLLVAPHSPDVCLVLGWPVANNFVVQFSTTEEKELWSGLLEKCCVAQMKLVQPDSLPITIINNTTSSNQMSDQMMVHCTETVCDVLARALEKRGMTVAQGSCQLLVKYSKDEAAVVLHGHEHPYAIQASQNRTAEGAGYMGAGTSETKPGPLQFYMKKKNIPPPAADPGERKKRGSRFKKGWYRVKKRKFRLFEAPLSTIIGNGQLPDILQEMLVRLYNEGPHTHGIFRVNANKRKVRELKESINNRQSVDILSDDISIHTIGALLKELVRNIRGGILLSSRYTEFVATNDIQDMDTRIHQIQRILQKLPAENLQFLHYLVPLLHHITQREKENAMDSCNLAIVFAPTLLWPDSGLDVIKNEVPPLIQFMIEHSPEIFGPDMPDLYRVLSPSPRSYRIPTKKNDGNMRSSGHARSNSLDTSTSEDSAGEDELPSNLLPMHRSGLTVSDSQVSVLSQQLEEEEFTSTATPNQTNILVMLSSSDGHSHRERFSHPPKRPKKSRPPERSSSYRGPNERPPYVQKYHMKVDDPSRRKSIATQTTLQHGAQLHYPSSPPSQGVTPSPSGAGPSSLPSERTMSSFAKSRQMQSFDENEEYEDGILNEVGRRHVPKRKPVHRQAYSVDHLMPSSNSASSFYDHLPPLGSGEGRPGSIAERHPRKLNLLGPQRSDSLETPMDDYDEYDETRWGHRSPITPGMGRAPPLHLTHSILSSTTDHTTPTTHASNQSIASRSSESSGSHYYPPSVGSSNHKLMESRPSNMSLVSESSFTSTSTVNKEESPEPEKMPLNREMVKYEITQRFQIPSRGNSFTSTHSAAKVVSASANRSDSFSMEMESLQKRFQERHRPEVLNSISTASSTTPHSEVEGLSSPPSIDDRPESERHLHSLPRHRSTEPDFLHSPPPAVQPAAAASVQAPVGGNYRRSRSSTAGERRSSGLEQDSNRLSIVDNNNSDTESSPSRTLTRRDRFGEANQRTFSTVTARFIGARGSLVMRQQGSVGQAMLGTPGRTINYPPSTVSEISIIPSERGEAKPRSNSASAKASLTHQSLPTVVQHAATPHRTTLEATPEETSPGARPKSAEANSRSGEEDLPETRKRTISNVEEAKMKLGLIASRARSKSISETKPATRPLADRDLDDNGERAGEARREGGLSQGAGEESERAKPLWEKGEKVDKRDIWRAHAPSSTDRKEAYTQRMRAGGSVRTGAAGNAAGNTDAPAPQPLAIQRTATAPEMGNRRRATTMPEYLVTRSSGITRQGGRVLGRGLVRTVKITSYQIPEVRKIHRINLRTFH